MVNVSKKSYRRPTLLDRVVSVFVMDAQPWWEYSEEEFARYLESRMK